MDAAAFRNALIRNAVFRKAVFRKTVSRIRRLPLPNRHAGLIALAGLPFLASFGFCTVARTPSRATGAVDRPALVFDQYFVNLSDLHNAARVEAWFHFKNCGKAPAKITHLEPSCGCLNPKVELRTYMPGEECEFPLGVLMTRERPGPHDYDVRIDYQDPKPRSVTVAFKVVVRREVTVRPSQLLFYQGDGEVTKQSIVITDMRPTPFRVTGASCKCPLVTFKVGPPVDDPDAGRETSVEITVGREPPKNEIRTAILLTTSDPRYPRIPIPIWIRDIHAPTKQSQMIQPVSGTATAPGSPTGH